MVYHSYTENGFDEAWALQWTGLGERRPPDGRRTQLVIIEDSPVPFAVH